MCSAVVPVGATHATGAPTTDRGRRAPQRLVQLIDARVRFGSVQALRDVNLTLHRGDRLALVGANGSGKTTLLRVLHGLVPSDGQRLVYLPPGERAPLTAMLFQRPFLLSLSV